MRKLLVILLAIMLIFSCGCSLFTPQTQEVENTAIVNLYVREGFIAQEILDAFTQETGILVKCYNLADEKMMQRKLATGISPFDLIISDNITVERLVETADVLQPIDTAKLSNYAKVSMHENALTDAARPYGIPYARTCTVFLHDVLTTRAPVTDYASIWAPYFKQRIIVAEEPRLLSSMALKSKGYPINTTDATALADAKLTLCALRENVLDMQSMSPAQDVAAGKGSLTMVWAQDAGAAKLAKPELELLYPRDGALMQAICMMISKTAPNMENAYLLADYLLRVENGVVICKASQLESLNAEAAACADEAYLALPAVHMATKHDAMAEYLHYVPDMGVYDDIWNAFEDTPLASEGQ